MKKSVVENLIAYLDGATVDTAELRDELVKELGKISDASAARADKKHKERAELIEKAVPVIRNCLSVTPKTAKEIFDAYSDDMINCGVASANSLQYILLNDMDGVKVEDNGRKAKRYSI